MQAMSSYNLKPNTYGGRTVPEDRDGFAGVNPPSKANCFGIGETWYVVRVRDGKVMTSGNAFYAAAAANHLNRGGTL